MRKRKYAFLVRLNAAEMQTLDKLCTTAGMPREIVIRKLIMGCSIKPRPPDSYRELSKQIAALGNNLNQIARAVNTCGIANDKQLVEVKRIMEEVWQRVENL